MKSLLPKALLLYAEMKMRKGRNLFQGCLANAQQDFKIPCRLFSLFNQFFIDTPDLQPIDQVLG